MDVNAVITAQIEVHTQLNSNIDQSLKAPISSKQLLKTCLSLRNHYKKVQFLFPLIKNKKPNNLLTSPYCAEFSDPEI